MNQTESHLLKNKWGKVFLRPMKWMNTSSFRRTAHRRCTYYGIVPVDNVNICIGMINF